MSLKEYKQKRHFTKTPEPKAKAVKKKISALSFVVHKHHASHLHYDLRLEQDGVLKSWAVPKGPSMNPEDKRLAMMVEDHPFDYKDFAGTIPAGNYGAGKVEIWDKGTYDLLNPDGIKKGHLNFVLHGRKLKGEFSLIKMAQQKKNAWLLIKKRENNHPSKKIKSSSSNKNKKTQHEITAEKLKKIGVKKLSFSTYFKPMLSYLIDKPFTNAQWIFEIKWDGYRILSYLNKKKAILLTRNNKDYSDIFSEIHSELKKMSLKMVIDGEVVVLDKNGRSDFQLLQQYRRTGEGVLVYYVFDILWLNGYDCRPLPLLMRKHLLQRSLPVSDKIRFSDYISTEGEDFFKIAQKQNVEGIVAKKSDSAYFSGRSNYWLKIKTKRRQEQDSNDELKLTHLQKIFWPKEGYTKKDLIDYYRNISGFILPHLKDRPEVLHRFPNGIEEPGFFQKNVKTSPKWVAAKTLYSESEKHNIRYLLCQNEATLIYLVNLGCIEINPWLARVGHLDKPDFCVIDLDPEDIPFSAVVKSAQAIHRLLEKIEVTHFLKTSGATGLHIYIPLGAKYSTGQSKEFAELIATIVNNQIPEFTSIVRPPKQRQKKVYLDFLQNRPNQTIAAPYSIRPLPQAPVSTPIFPKELTSKLYPQLFTIKTIFKRLERYGDIWSDILTAKINLNQAIANLQRLQR